MSNNSDHLFIIYQGYAEQWNWRKVDAEGVTVRDAAGEPIQSGIKFKHKNDARDDLLSFDPEADITERPAANFDESIDDAEEREELEQQERERANG